MAGRRIPFAAIIAAAVSLAPACSKRERAIHSIQGHNESIEPVAQIPMPPPGAPATCKPLTAPHKTRVSPEQALKGDMVARAFAGQKADKVPPIDPQKRAAELNAQFAQGENEPLGRWTSCLDRVTETRIANQRLVPCVRAIPICDDPRGGFGCCPRTCIEAFEHRWKERCPSGDCDVAMEQVTLNETLMKGDCVPGFGEQMEPSRNREAMQRRDEARRLRSDLPAIAAGAKEAFVVIASGVYRSSDDGKTWSSAEAGLETVRVLSLAANGRLAALTDGANVYAWDGNASRWENTDPDPALNLGRKDRPHQIGRVTVGKAGELLVWGNFGEDIFTSRDRGRTWEQLSRPVPGAAGTISRATDGVLYYEARNRQVFYSIDGARTWRAIPLDPSIHPILQVTGLPSGRFIPSPPDVIIDREGRLLARRNGGGMNVPTGSRQWMHPDEIIADRGRLYCVGAGAAWTSTDAIVWTQLTPPGDEIRRIAVTTTGTLLAISKKAVFRSADRGTIWTRTAGE